MALPVTISGVSLSDTNSNGQVGPFLSGGKFYGVFRDSTTDSNLDVFSATDPTSSWSQEATISLTDTIDNISVYQDGTNLHIATMHTSGNALRYHVFSMSSDSFTTSNENTGAAGQNTALECKSDITVRSDGDVLIIYSGQVDIL